MPVSLSISEIGLSATICLNMIVKNEAHIIIETLNNLCHYIPFAYWVISDTGSTDDTKKLICDFFAEKKIPGELVEHEWQDFAYNRTKALECAFGKTDYLLIFDADDSIQGNFKLPTIYNIDKYHVQFGPGLVYTRPLLITNKKRWCFKGVLHETLANIDYMNGEVVLEGDYYVISGRAGNRSKNPNKYFDDAIVLKNAFEKELHVDYGMACRYAFYCAQSYKDAGVAYTDESIIWYQKCLDLGNWDQEKYYSCLMLGGLYTHKNDMVNALKYWFKSCEYDNERIECIVSAINYLRSTSQHMFVNSLYHRFKGYKRANKLYGKLFMLETNFNDELEYHNSIVAYYVGDKASGYDCCKKIIINNVIGYPLLKSTMTNILFYKELMESDLNTLDLFYAYDNAISRIYLENDIGDPKIFEGWQLLFLKNRANLTKYIGMGMGNKNTALFNHINNIDSIDSIDLTKPTIFMSFTTCKRLDLFKQTINSMINHWSDLNKIDYWFCVDDNSAEEDRSNMRTLYPWIEYHMKSVEGKGHRASMNIIWNKLNELKPTYWIHMEDDFLFHNKMNYIEEAIKGLTSPEFLSNNVNQILFNRNYGETIDQYTVGGHLVNGSHKPFVLHDYNLSQYNYPTCHYWPHYSFRPSMTKTSIVLGLGNFDSPNQFFEMDYANKWTGAGNKSGFFNKITNRHIGRLTSDKDTRTVKNAYELNQESQFLGTADPVSVFNSKSIKIINLERRPDRKLETIGKLDAVGISSGDYEFINGVDGLKLVPTLELKKLFEGNDFGSRRGFIGCAMSHYNLWKQLIDDDKNEYYVIMEDDFTLCPEFKTRYSALLDSGVFKQYDVLFLGYLMFELERNKVLNVYNNFDNVDVTAIEPLNKQLYIGGFHAYSINKTGARKMIDYIAVNGIKHGIDYMMKIVSPLNCFETRPQLSFAEWNEDGKNIDTDIQCDFVGMDFNNIGEIPNNIYINGISGLGNNLYQIAVAIYYKETYKNCNIILNQRSECLNLGTGNKFGKNRLKTSYLNTLLNKFDTIYIIPNNSIILYNDCNTLNKIDLSNKTNKNIVIDGYCQNIDLFFEIRNKLWDYFNIENEDSNNSILQKYTINKESINIMLGIRVGMDGGFKYSKFTKKSYKKVIDDIVSSNKDMTINIYILCDVENIYSMIDDDPEKYTIIYVNEDDISQLYIGLMCNYFILSDSTYHWWIAFLKWVKDSSVNVYYPNNTDITNRCLLNTQLKSAWKCFDLIPNDNFIFIQGLDYMGNDLFRNDASIPVMSDIAEKDDNCVAFNTLGFFKKNIDVNKLVSSPYFNENDGIYIKKEYYETNKNILTDMGTFEEIAEYFVLDKCSKYLHNYIPIYEKYLNKIKNNVCNIFEIGIGCIEQNQMTHMTSYGYKTGNSLRAWKQYCKNANVFGIDIFKDSLFEEPGIKTYICDQSSSEQLTNLINTINVKMDLIVDDGSHIMEHQVISFIVLEKYLTSNGIYIIEDIWNKNFETWKQLSCFPNDYIPYIKLNYDIFYYDQSSPRSNTSDCMCVFIKKDICNTISRIKMLCNWTTSEQLCKEWSNMCDDPAEFRWKDIRLTWTDDIDIIDYYVIINSPPPNTYYDPKKTIVFQMEPWVNDPTKNWGVKTWSEWSVPDPAKFLAVRGRKTSHHNNAFWQLELNYNQLSNLQEYMQANNIVKSSSISSICSSKYFDEGHIARIDLLKYIESKNDESVHIDIYNQDNNHQFKNYAGPVTPYVDKSKGMLSYKYYFMIENNYEPGFITEKIWEPILCESLVFYYGCPNISEYIDCNAYVLLDITDFEKSYQIIKRAIEEDWWSQRIDIIRKEKQRILNELAFFPVIEKMIIYF